MYIIERFNISKSTKRRFPVISVLLNLALQFFFQSGKKAAKMLKAWTGAGPYINSLTFKRNIFYNDTTKYAPCKNILSQNKTILGLRKRSLSNETQKKIDSCQKKVNCIVKENGLKLWPVN